VYNGFCRNITIDVGGNVGKADLMSMQIKINAVNQADAGTCILSRNEAVNCICMILRGKAAVRGKGVNLLLGAGSFLGINDFYAGQYLCDYVAIEDVTFFAFPVSAAKGLKHILAANRDYGGLMVWAFSRYITELGRLYGEVCDKAKQVGEEVKAYYIQYNEYGVAAGLNPRSLTFAEELKPFSARESLDARKLEYYREASRIPLEKHKEYYLDSIVMSEQQVEDEVAFINKLLNACAEAAEYLEDVFYCLINNSDKNLFLYVASLLVEVNQKGTDTEVLSGMLDELTDRINSIESFLCERLGSHIDVDRKRMEEVYVSVISGNAAVAGLADEEDSFTENLDEEHMNQIKKILSGSLQQILTFSEWEEAKAEAFRTAIESFIGLEDRLSVEDTVRKLKREISKQFFDLYQDVFLHAYAMKTLPMAVELFLDYAYVDERLITEEQLMQFCSFKKEGQESPCEVYTIREWLRLVYEGKKEPSRSDLDMTFEENLRDMKKRGLLTEEQMRAAATDRKTRLDYEIHNMFACNDRLVNGQISTFVPILYAEGLGWAPSKSYLTKKKVNELILRLMQKDPTVFYREVMYRSEALEIEKEFVMKQVFPEIILLPCNGVKAIMWQEITGKRRDSKARFLLPHFYEGDPEDAMVQTLGRFRWELCRTMMGLSWNNIQIKSLTSEFCDYLQYYRKNHELSEEKREKVKLQLQKAKNSTKEAFVQDYEIWVKYESAGAVRLNKVARELLATYCPFGIELRNSLKTQPIFEDAMGRFERGRSKKVYELEMRYRVLEREKGELPEALKENLNYYKNL